MQLVLSKMLLNFQMYEKHEITTKIQKSLSRFRGRRVLILLCHPQTIIWARQSIRYQAAEVFLSRFSHWSLHLIKISKPIALLMKFRWKELYRSLFFHHASLSCVLAKISFSCNKHSTVYHYFIFHGAVYFLIIRANLDSEDTKIPHVVHAITPHHGICITRFRARFSSRVFLFSSAVF